MSDAIRRGEVVEGLRWPLVEAETAADLPEHYTCDGLCGLREVQIMGQIADTRWGMNECCLPITNVRYATLSHAREENVFKIIIRACDQLSTDSLSFLAGIATALKILFSSEDHADGSDSGQTLRPDNEIEGLELERNEVIALINLLERFSSAISYYHSMSQALQTQQPRIRPVLSMTEEVA